MSLAPINLSEAAQDFATGDFGDLEPGDILLEFAPMFQTTLHLKHLRICLILSSLD